MQDDWTTVVPSKGDVVATAKFLLGLAHDPGDVHTTAGGNEFRIPPYLAELYNSPAEPPKRRRRSSKEGEAE